MGRIALVAVLLALAATVIARRRRAQARQQAAAPTDRPAPPPSKGTADAPAPDSARDATPAGLPFASVAWTLVAAPAEQAELTVECHQDDELELVRVDAQETPTQVFLTAIARRRRRDDGEPPRERARATVKLSEPLGQRTLIATPVDAWPDDDKDGEADRSPQAPQPEAAIPDSLPPAAGREGPPL